jgi:hypothetical protein
MLEPVLQLLVKHVADPRFGELVCDVSSLIIGAFHALLCKGSHPLTPLQSCMLPYWDSHRPLMHFFFACKRKLRRKSASNVNWLRPVVHSIFCSPRLHWLQYKVVHAHFTTGSMAPFVLSPLYCIAWYQLNNPPRM